MHISEHGQVTIPRKLRERYGLLPDTEVRFVPDEQGLRLVADPATRATTINNLDGRKRFGRSTDELMAVLRTSNDNSIGGTQSVPYD